MGWRGVSTWVALLLGLTREERMLGQNGVRVLEGKWTELRRGRSVGGKDTPASHHDPRDGDGARSAM